MFLGFLAKVVGRWLATHPFGAVGPSRQRLNHSGWNNYRSEPEVGAIVGVALMRKETGLPKKKRTDQPIKNLLAQWEMRKKTVVENFL